MSFKGAKMPSAPPKGAGALAKLVLVGGTLAYAGLNSFYNVEGGHRAIVFNRLEGIKDKVSHLDHGREVVRCANMADSAWIWLAFPRRCTPKGLT